MTVYVAASDETRGSGGPGSGLTYGGWVASEADWAAFRDEWESRVLAGPPKLDYFHMTVVRGLPDVNARLDAAIDVVSRSPGLTPISVTVGVDDYDELVAAPAKRDPAFRTDLVKAQLWQPDYCCLVGYTMHVLAEVRRRCPDADRVDFILERAKGLTDSFEALHDQLRDALGELGSPDLASLMGTCRAVPKTEHRREVEAADLLCWYRQRRDRGLLGGADIDRFNRLVDRPGVKYAVPQAYLRRLAKALRGNRGEKAD